MIYRYHISHSFGRLKDPDFYGFGSHVLEEMTDNEYYLEPTPPLDLLDAELEAYEKAYGNTVGGGGRIATSLKKTARKNLLLTLQTLASYVLSQGQNNSTILLSSGFKLWKNRAPVGDLPAPESLRYRYLKSEELYLYFARVHRAANYSLQLALSENGPWEDRGISTSTRVTITNLVPGTRYWIRVCANGTAGPSPWSTALSVMAV
jgi:hypothetical protein